MRRRDLLVDVLESYRNRIVSVERDSACEHLVHYDTKRIDVGSLIYIVAPCLLRREVMYRADDLAACRQCSVIDSPGDTKVCQLDYAVIGDHYVVRLDVSVDDLVLVSDFKRRSYLLADVDHLSVIHRSFVLNDLVERTAFDELHNDVVDVALSAYVIDTYYIRMCKSCGRLRLSLEVLYEGRILGEFRS